MVQVRKVTVVCRQAELDSDRAFVANEGAVDASAVPNTVYRKLPRL